jgi:hypothetical protein
MLLWADAGATATATDTAAAASCTGSSTSPLRRSRLGGYHQRLAGALHSVYARLPWLQRSAPNVFPAVLSSPSRRRRRRRRRRIRGY